jgi:DNA-binding NarL/FixJ family response regulator
MSARDVVFALDRQGRPFAVDRAANGRLAELLRDVANGGAGGIVRVKRPDGKPAYAAMVAPLVLDDGVETRSRRKRGALFVIHDPLSEMPKPRLVADLFGLPQGAASLLAALCAGDDLKDYSERTGISLNTVRFHLKTAFARVGVRRQSDLMRRVTATLRDLADHRGQNDR